MISIIEHFWRGNGASHSFIHFYWLIQIYNLFSHCLQIAKASPDGQCLYKKQNKHSKLYSIHKQTKVDYVNAQMVKSRRKVKLKTMLRLTGIQNINQKLTSTLFPVELLGHCFPSLRSVCCLYPCFVQIVSTSVELGTT